MTALQATQEPDVESLRQLTGHSPLPSYTSSFLSSCSSSLSVSSIEGNNDTDASPDSLLCRTHIEDHARRVLRVQAWWDAICDYFLRVQRADTEAERTALVEQMNLVERNLRHILHALLRERSQACHRVGADIAEAVYPSPATQPLSQATRSEDGDDGGHRHDAMAEVHTSVHASTDEAAVHQSPSPSLPILPPCYAYLFSLPSQVDIDSSSCMTQKQDAEASTPSSARSDEARVTGRVPQPIATTFFLMLCLYTKHNNPVGTRGLLLRFLTRLLHDADLTVASGHSSNAGLGRHACSLLQRHPSVTIVPLLDMIRQVAAALHPARAARDRGGGSVIEHSLLVPPPSLPPLQQHSLLKTHSRPSTEHTDFVRFLCALAEKVEQIPSLASFFLTQTAWETTIDEKEENTNEVTSGMSSAPESFVLLQALLPYLTHDSSSAEWHARRETCRYALSAVLSLAKCPDVAVQNLVAAERSIITRTLIGASTTLVTLCKVPENDDSAVQLLYLIDVLRFWSALDLCAPAVARQLDLHASVEAFTQTTLLPLLQSRDTHVYAAACLVVAHAVTRLNTAWPLITRLWLTAILATVVDPHTGHCVEGATDYYTLAALQSEEGEVRHNNSTAVVVAARQTSMTSFCNYYIVPHLTHSPTLSEEDIVNCAVLGFSLTEWTATEASLVLLRSLAVADPYHFMRYVFLLDMGTITAMALESTHYNNTSNSSVHEEGRSDVAATSPCDLSAAASSPRIELAECFSPRLRLPQSARVAAEMVGHEVLARLLRIESNTPNAMLQLRTCVINPQCAAMHQGAIRMPSHEADNDDSTSHTPGLMLPRRTSQRESSITTQGKGNVWLHHGVQRAPVTVALCDLLGHALSLPASVTLLLTELLTCLCLMPDLRVWYTLMDVEYGRLDHALHRLRALLEAELDKDVSTTIARKTSDVQSATLRVRSEHGAMDVDDTARAHGEGRNVTTNTAGSSVRAGGLLRRWTGLMSGGRRSESRGETAAQSASVTSSDAHGGTGENVLTANDVHTRGQLYHVYVEQVLPYVQEGSSGSTLINHPYQRAIAAERAFLDLCVNMEYFRLELDAVVGYVALSHNLMTLKFGESDKTGQ